MGGAPRRTSSWTGSGLWAYEDSLVAVPGRTSWRRWSCRRSWNQAFVERLRGQAVATCSSLDLETLDAIGSGPLAPSRATPACFGPTRDVGAPQDARGVQPRRRRPAGRRSAELRGLHAKLFVVDDAWWSRIWTGSANATMAAFAQNVEFLVEMRGRNTTHGAMSHGHCRAGSAVGFGRLLEDYEPPADPVPLPLEEQAMIAVDHVAMSLGGLSFVAKAEATEGDVFRLRLVGTGDVGHVTMAVARGSRSRFDPSRSEAGRPSSRLSTADRLAPIGPCRSRR